MSIRDYLLEQTAVYSLWQAPFVLDKLAPLLAHNDLSKVRRVLDVGCGPGTNTHLFEHADYLGIEINPRYVQHALRKYNRRFEVADVTTYEDETGVGYDFILVNSFLHHIEIEPTHQILDRLQRWLTPDGHIHLIELVVPGDRSIPQLLAKVDRGKYPRSIAEWRSIFERHFDLVVFEPYPVKGFGVALWQLVYAKGKAKQ
jgi:SAM-dependent methyltransferase